MNYVNGGLDWIEDDENNGEPILANACDGAHHPAKRGLVGCSPDGTRSREPLVSVSAATRGTRTSVCGGQRACPQRRGRAGHPLHESTLRDRGPRTTPEVGCPRAAAGSAGGSQSPINIVDGAEKEGSQYNAEWDDTLKELQLDYSDQKDYTLEVSGSGCGLPRQRAGGVAGVDSVVPSGCCRRRPSSLPTDEC